MEGDGFGSDSFGGDGFGAAGPGPAEGSETGESDYGGGMGISLGDIGGSGGGIATFGDALFSDPSITESILGDFGFGDFGEGLGNFGYGQNDLSSLFSQNESNPFSELFQGKLGKSLMALLGLADKSGVVSQIGKFGSLATSPNPAKGMANIGLAMGLNALAPGLGMFAGPIGQATGLSNAFSGTVGLQGGQPADSGVGGMLQGLGGLYAGYKGMKENGDMLGSLQSLYSQNSPYAQALRQQLQRQDAAGGRRSQYGPREVELQARLAQMASSQIPAMSQLQQNKTLARNAMLQQGLGAFDRMGGLKGLQSLFGFGGQGGLYDNAATQLINSGSLGNLFSLDPLISTQDTSWIPEYSGPDWG